MLRRPEDDDTELRRDDSSVDGVGSSEDDPTSNFPAVDGSVFNSSTSEDAFSEHSYEDPDGSDVDPSPSGELENEVLAGEAVLEEEVPETFEERPTGWLDADTKSFLVSFICHVIIIVVLAAIPILSRETERLTVITASPADLSREEEVFEIVPETAFSDLPSDAIGADSLGEESMALSMAPVVADVSEIPIPEIMQPQLTSTVSLATSVEQAVGLVESSNVVQGLTGVGVTGTDGAVDRITYEILQSIESGPTLVVWLFDASGSLTRRRQEIRDRFDKIYDELGLLTGEQADDDDALLLTSVMTFGNQVQFATETPTANIDVIRDAVDTISNDPSGVEQTFAALTVAMEKHKKYCGAKTADRDRRKVMMIVVTDERGDDDARLESTIGLYRKYAIPVYVVGVPAPFGRQHTYVKYVDPDPQYDQTPSWAKVDQGPESALSERIQLGYEDNYYDEPILDSGFGPYALSRLCFETGGIYFTIHPNRKVGGRVGGGQIDAFASNLSYFFDPDVMGRYRPDYLSREDYLARVQDSPMRRSLLQAGQFVRTGTLDRPRLRFERINEANFVNALSNAQREAARLEPRLGQLVDLLLDGEKARDRELSPRWMASFDLSLGTALAEKVRTETYNLMLAKAKRGLDYSSPKNNTWTLRPANEISVGSRYEKEAEAARESLERVVKLHDGTPWSLLAQRQLDRPIGWKWVDSFTDPDPPMQNNAAAANNNPPPQDDMRRMVNRPTKRPVPKL